MYIDMLARARQTGQAINIDSRGIMAGSICPEQLLLDLKKHVRCDVRVAYGTTENSPITTMTTVNDDLDQKTKTVGAVMPHTEAKVIDQHGAIVNRGETGELLIRGVCVFKGYFNEPDKTEEVIDENGWCHTGDLAVMRDDGHVKIVGRNKDMIVRGGENIYPAEIEGVLLQHESIIDVQIIGVQSRRLGEEVFKLL